MSDPFDLRDIHLEEKALFSHPRSRLLKRARLLELLLVCHGKVQQESSFSGSWPSKSVSSEGLQMGWSLSATRFKILGPKTLECSVPAKCFSNVSLKMLNFIVILSVVDNRPLLPSVRLGV